MVEVVFADVQLLHFLMCHVDPKNMTDCLYCGVQIEQTGRGRRRRYCSTVCKSRFYSQQVPRRTTRRRGLPDEIAFFRHVEFVTEGPYTGCWLWTGAVSRGYGHFYVPSRKKVVLAHRWLYEFVVGEIPKGLDCDHQCHNNATWCRNHYGVECLHRRCVAWFHVEPVTRSLNAFRGERSNRFVTHCPSGHEYTEENTYIRIDGPDGRNRSRKCRTCSRAAAARRRARARQQAGGGEGEMV